MEEIAGSMTLIPQIFDLLNAKSDQWSSERDS